MHDQRIGAVFHQNPYDARLAETGREPEGRGADQFGAEMEVFR